MRVKKGNVKAGVGCLAVGEAPTKAAVHRLVDFSLRNSERNSRNVLS